MTLSAVFVSIFDCDVNTSEVLPTFYMHQQDLISLRSLTWTDRLPRNTQACETRPCLHFVTLATDRAEIPFFTLLHMTRNKLWTNMYNLDVGIKYAAVLNSRLSTG